MRQFNTLLRQPDLAAKLNTEKLDMRMKEAQAAQKIWEEIAPDNLAQLSHAGSIENRQLILFTSSNSVAAKIKLFIPSLLIKLEKQECEVTSIRVKVQVKSTPEVKPKVIKKLSAHAANDIAKLAKRLSGTALGDALARLATKAD